MKILAVVVALAIAIGPEGLVVRAAQFSPSKLKDIISGFERLVRASIGSATGKLDLLGNSTTGRALLDQFNELIDSLTNLDRQMPAEISEAVRLPFSIFGGITVKAVFNLDNIGQQSRHDFERVFEALEDYLEPMLETVSSFVEPLLDPFGPKICEIDQEMNARIAQTMESLDGHLPFYIKRVREIQDGLQPLAEEVGRQFRLRMETLNENLKPYLEPLLKEGREYADAFTEWMNSFLSLHI